MELGTWLDGEFICLHGMCKHQGLLRPQYFNMVQIATRHGVRRTESLIVIEKIWELYLPIEDLRTWLTADLSWPIRQCHINQSLTNCQQGIIHYRSPSRDLNPFVPVPGAHTFCSPQLWLS